MRPRPRFSEVYMNEIWDFDECVSVFRQEIALLQKISLVQNSVQNTVMNREWADFDWRIAEINQLGEEFQQLETKRTEIFGALREKFMAESAPETEISFYSLAARLPQDECRELSGLYRDLKMETIRLKARNETFAGYLNEIKTITAAWLEAVFPAQSGKLYTRKGRQVSGGLFSMILNQHI